MTTYMTLLQRKLPEKHGLRKLLFRLFYSFDVYGFTTYYNGITILLIIISGQG